MVGGTGTGALAEATAGVETGTPSAAGMAMTAAAGVDRDISSTMEMNLTVFAPWPHYCVVCVNQTDDCFEGGVACDHLKSNQRLL